MGRTPPLRIKAPPRPTGQALESVIETAVIRMLVGAASPARIVIGPSTDAILAIALRRPRVMAALETFSKAHLRTLGSGDDAARVVLRNRTRGLQAELRRAGREVPDLADDAREAARALDDVVGRIRLRSGRAASRIGGATWWDRISDHARQDGGVRTALALFQDAAASGDEIAIRQAADDLNGAIAKRVSFSRAQEFANRINGAVRRLLSGTSSQAGEAALAALHAYTDGLAATDPVRAALTAIAPAIEASPDRWYGLGRIVGGLTRATNLDEAQGMVWRLKGLLGEMLAISTKAYLDIYQRALLDADALARRLNASPPGGWQVAISRTQIRAPQSGTSRLAPFYDDLIFLRRIGETGDSEAIVVLATQVKSGDWSSAQVISQFRSDIRREAGGMIEVDSVLYRFPETLPEGFAPRRVFAGTLLPPPERVIGAPGTIDPVILPMSGDDLEALAWAFLDANQLLP